MPNVKMGADISSFKSGIAAAKSEVKTLDQQMKMLDATMKAEGKSEQTLNQQMQTLNSRMAAQKNMANQAEAALKAMTKQGVDPASEAYQRMARDLLAAQTGMMETQAALNDLGQGAVQAAGGVEQLESGLNGISKKISLDQVITGIGRITDGLENAAKKAINLGESIWDNIMNSAKWADDTATQALMYGIDVETFQRMQKLVTNGMDTSVEAMLKAQDRLKKGVGSGSKEVIDQLQALGVAVTQVGKIGGEQIVAKDSVALFWEMGQAIMAMGDAYKQEDAAQTLFGRSWKDLVPLFKEYKSVEEYNAALKDVKINSEDGVNKLVKLNDTVGTLQGNLQTMGNVLAITLAPGLTTLADSLNSLLESVLDYLETDNGKAMLESMKESFTGLFDGLKDISAEDVVKGFQTVFDSIVGGFKWINENGETLLGILEGIGAFWAGLQVSQGVLTLLKVIDGLKGLTGAGAAAGAAGAGNALATGLGTAMTAVTQKVAGLLGSSVLQNSVPYISDWFIHNTGIGQEISGTKEKGSTMEEIRHNFETFADQDNPIFNFFRDMGTNSILFWNDFWKKSLPEAMNQTGKNIQIAGENTHGDDWTVEDAMREATGGTPVQVEVQPEMPEDAAAQIAEQIGTVTVYVEPIIDDGSGYSKRTPRRNGIPGHANGIWSVPFDNYLALLHKDERVVPARAVNNRNFTSNLYFENVNVNNGQDADGLAARIVTTQQREMSGFGS